MERWLDRLRREIEEATRGLSEAEWSRAPEGRWNSAQILEHLGRTYGSTAKMLEKSLAASDASGGPPPLRSATPRERLIQFLVVRLGRFPSGRKSPEFLLPEGQAGPEALRRTLGGLERMRTALDAAEKCWGGRQPVAAHFVLGPMRVEQWRKFHYVHGHHHVLQIGQRVGR
jgi:DinB superfamily